MDRDPAHRAIFFVLSAVLQAAAVSGVLYDSCEPDLLISIASDRSWL
ncbi:MAG: hypothetical protein ACO1QR_12365 [Chthoniobacteraceae bacterium]